MGTITPFVSATNGHARLEIDWTSHPSSGKAWVWRLVDGVLTPLRDTDLLLLSHAKAVIYDVEAPLDVPIRYRTTTPLNTNGSFEETVDQWVFSAANTGTNGTVTQSTDYYLSGRGNASLKLINSGAAAESRASSEFIPVTVGVSYTASGYLMVPTAWSGGLYVQLRWYNGTSLLSTTSGTANLWPAVGKWEFYTVTGTAPATATQMRIAGAFAGTPPLNIPLYVDELWGTTPLGTVDASSDVVIPSDGGGWWKDPLHPATNVRLSFDVDVDCIPTAGTFLLGLTEKTFPDDSAIQEITDSPEGIATWSRRKSHRSSVQVATRAQPDRDQMRALHSSGAPLFLQLPAQYGEADKYMQCGELIESRITQDHRIPARVFRVPYARVLQPTGPADGVYGTRYSDLDKYATFGAANAAGITWVDVLQGEATL